MHEEIPWNIQQKSGAVGSSLMSVAMIDPDSTLPVHTQVRRSLDLLCVLGS